jgi:hypothetical protein
LVVPDMADNTTITGSLPPLTSSATDRILSGVPTEVPPNFITFIIR